MDKYKSKVKAEEYAKMSWPNYGGIISEDFYQKISQIIQSTVKEINDDNLMCVEIGFGAGRNIYDLACFSEKVNIIGIENSSNMIDITKLFLKRNLPDYQFQNQISLQKGSIENIDLNSEVSKFVICINVLDRVINVKKSIKEIFRITEEGGNILIVNAFDYENKTPKDQRMNIGEMKKYFSKLGGRILLEQEIYLHKKIDFLEKKYNEHLFLIKKERVVLSSKL
jgi:ubiquinone/menaquinone biosynthesis C-methylase UbiE